MAWTVDSDRVSIPATFGSSTKIGLKDTVLVLFMLFLDLLQGVVCALVGVYLALYLIAPHRPSVTRAACEHFKSCSITNLFYYIEKGLRLFTMLTAW